MDARGERAEGQGVRRFALFPLGLHDYREELQKEPNRDLHLR